MLLLFFFPYSFLQSTRVEFDLPEYSVRRRYQDFDWLRSKLEESQPTHLIPVGSERYRPFACLARAVLEDALPTPAPKITDAASHVFYARFAHHMYRKHV